jgi:hypothetical protein
MGSVVFFLGLLTSRTLSLNARFSGIAMDPKFQVTIGRGMKEKVPTQKKKYRHVSKTAYMPPPKQLTLNLVRKLKVPNQTNYFTRIVTVAALIRVSKTAYMPLPKQFTLNLDRKLKVRTQTNYFARIVTVAVLM